MAADEILKLEVWPGEWDLPSFDPDCLMIMTYCKISGVPVKTIKGNNPTKSPSGQFPILYHSNHKESSIPNIMTYLHKQNWGIDRELDKKENADIQAFSSLIHEKLLPAYLHSWWIDTQAYNETTYPLFAKTLSFPRNFYLPRRIKASASICVYAPKTTLTITEKDIDQMVYKDAKQCLNILSSKLGNNDFMLGSRPSSLDALVFAYLAPLLKGPLPKNELVIHLNSIPNLCALCNRILVKYFPISLEEKEKKKEEDKQKKQDNVDPEFPNKKRNMILAGLFALTAMVLFTLTSGMRVEIGLVHKPQVYAEEYEEYDFSGDDKDEDQ